MGRGIQADFLGSHSTEARAEAEVARGQAPMPVLGAHLLTPRPSPQEAASQSLLWVLGNSRVAQGGFFYLLLKRQVFFLPEPKEFGVSLALEDKVHALL